MFVNPTIKLPILHSQNPLWFNGSMVQWFNGSMVQWFNGSMVQWFNGSMVQWFNGQIATTQDTQNHFRNFTLYSRNFLQVVAFLFQLLLEEVQRFEEPPP
jgi:hypothetical protein